jgi:hypothetical protein
MGVCTDGAYSADGEFLPLPSLDASAAMDVFRRMLLLRLHKAERLSESFMQNLPSWVHSGFSAYAGPPVDAAESASIESQARLLPQSSTLGNNSEAPADIRMLIGTSGGSPEKQAWQGLDGY